jgi:hypothetical protein
MIFYFPNLDSLRLALTSGMVPPAVSLKPAVAGFDDQDHLWLQTAEALPRGAQAALGRLGVQVKKTSDAALSIDVCCWLQALPLEPAAAPQALPATQAPVLFELTNTAQLSDLVAEILRLGNDRQSFRWLENDGETRGLLRVIGPPYYSLLRALDRSGQAAPRAYVEHAPRVWVEVGYTHPLLPHIKPPKKQLLFLRPPRDWTLLDEAPFQDIYDILEFELPQAKIPWQPVPLKDRLRVPLRLTRGGRGEEAELWVLRERAVDHLDAFVRSADDQLLARLAFAVCETGAESCIVLRVRPSKLPPPVLVLPAEPFRSYLKLANLFLPCATQLHPPLRRDAVRKLLADDPDRVIWLYPGEGGTFTPEGMPDAAFRPLTDWVEYVLDHDRAALQAWVQAAQFDFEPFICKDDHDPAARTAAKEPSRRAPKDKAKAEEPPVIPAQTFNVVKGSQKKKQAADQVLQELPRVKPSELQERLRAVEKQFLEISGPLDAPERLALWPQLAQLNKALRNDSDATVCWVNALWEADEQAPQLARAWARGECLGAGAEVTGEELDRLLVNERAGLAEVRGLASCLVWAVRQEQPPAALLLRLGAVQRFLEVHELLLPLRGAWLAWASLVQLTRGDVLALARARDRLLEQLFTRGLSPDRDLPSFLRFSGMRSSDRYRVFRDWLMGLSDKVRRWVERNKGAAENDSRFSIQTPAYADLILSFGLARLGEAAEARRLRQQAAGRLGERDDVHTTLLEAFGYRIDQALEGKPAGGPLPPEQHEYLEHMERLGRYKVDRLRKNSRILEPHERIDPYRTWTAHFFNELEKTLANLTDLRDRQELAERIRQLLAHSWKDKAARNKHPLVMIKALELAPRVGEDFTLEVLSRVAPALELLDRGGKAAEASEAEARTKADFLEKALVAAAHFNHVEFVPSLLDRFEELLRSLRGSKNLTAIESLIGESFRGLRKLGMRDQIERLLRVLEDVILQGKKVGSLRGGENSLPRLTQLLPVASNWFSFGRDAQARPVLDLARSVLYQGELRGQEQTNLACAYVSCLGQAPLELAQPGIEEVFARLERVNDAFTTNSHYSASQLRVVEAVVLAVVTEEFAVGTTARHWLDDDEFLVRRRLHRDMQTLMNQTHW